MVKEKIKRKLTTQDSALSFAAKDEGQNKHSRCSMIDESNPIKQRSSIINQGEVILKRKMDKEAARLANFED